MNRYFVRCAGCLEISSVECDALPYGLKCGICDTHVDNMGRVQQGDEGARLVKDHVRCACDARCTGARGPWCSCSCGGKNHGAGMAAVIRYTSDAGAVPVLMPRTAELEAKARARFAEWIEVLTVLRAEENAIYERRRAGEYLPRPTFMRMLELQRTINDARKLKTHAARMKKLVALVDGTPVVDATPVAVVDAPAEPVAPVAVRMATEPQAKYVASLLKQCKANGIAHGLDVDVDALTFDAARTAIETMKPLVDAARSNANDYGYGARRVFAGGRFENRGNLHPRP